MIKQTSKIYTGALIAGGLAVLLSLAFSTGEDNQSIKTVAEGSSKAAAVTVVAQKP